MLDVPRHLRGVGQHQVQHGHPDARLDVAEMPVADRDDPQHDGQLAQDDNQLGRHQTLARLDLPRALRNQRVGGDRGDQIQQRITGTAAQDAAALDTDLGIARPRQRDFVQPFQRQRLAVPNVGHQKHEQRYADERQPAAGQIRLEQRTAHHRGVQQQTQQQQGTDGKQPEISQRLDLVAVLQQRLARRLQRRFLGRHICHGRCGRIHATRRRIHRRIRRGFVRLRLGVGRHLGIQRLGNLPDDRRLDGHRGRFGRRLQLVFEHHQTTGFDARLAPVLGHQQPGRQQNQQYQVQIPHAPEPPELEIQAEHQQRR